MSYLFLRKRSFLRVASVVFIILGFVFLTDAAYLTWQRNNPGRLAFASYESIAGSVHTAKVPAELIINSIRIHVPVKSTELIDGKWEAHADAVSYLASSSMPGEKGNSILYGHNWASLLGSLHKIKPDDTIDIIFTDGTREDFVVVYTQTVSPDQTHILNNTEDTRITLYTCTGFLDSKRFVVTAIKKAA